MCQSLLINLLFGSQSSANAQALTPSTSAFQQFGDLVSFIRGLGKRDCFASRDLSCCRSHAGAYFSGALASKQIGTSPDGSSITAISPVLRLELGWCLPTRASCARSEPEIASPRVAWPGGGDQSAGRHCAPRTMRSQRSTRSTRRKVTPPAWATREPAWRDKGRQCRCGDVDGSLDLYPRRRLSRGSIQDILEYRSSALSSITICCATGLTQVRKFWPPRQGIRLHQDRPDEAAALLKEFIGLESLEWPESLRQIERHLADNGLPTEKGCEPSPAWRSSDQCAAGEDRRLVLRQGSR